MSSCDTMFRYHRSRLVNLHLPHTVVLNSSVYVFLLHENLCFCLIDLIMIQTFLFPVLCSTLSLIFHLYLSLSLTYQQQEQRNKKTIAVINATVDIFVLLFLFIHVCSSLFDFLIYYNLGIYMNKAVRSVECYLLPSCVFVNGTFEEKKSFFSFVLTLSKLCEL